jgi:hypothetical protein
MAMAGMLGDLVCWHLHGVQCPVGRAGLGCWLEEEEEEEEE